MEVERIDGKLQTTALDRKKLFLASTNEG